MKPTLTPLILLLASCESKAPENMSLTIDFHNPAHMALMFFLFAAWTLITALSASAEESGWIGVPFIAFFAAILGMLVSIGQLIAAAL